MQIIKKILAILGGERNRRESKARRLRLQMFWSAERANFWRNIFPLLALDDKSRVIADRTTELAKRYDPGLKH